MKKKHKLEVEKCGTCFMCISFGTKCCMFCRVFFFSHSLRNLETQQRVFFLTQSRTGVIKLPILGGLNKQQICGNFEGFALQNALFGLLQ